MVYKRYYSPFEEQREPRRIPEGEVLVPHKAEPAPEEHRHPPPPRQNALSSLGNFLPLDWLGRVQSDDLLLIGVLVLLLTEEQEQRDIPLILTIGFLLLIEYIERK